MGCPLQLYEPHPHLYVIVPNWLRNAVNDLNCCEIWSNYYKVTDFLFLFSSITAPQVERERFLVHILAVFLPDVLWYLLAGNQNKEFNFRHDWNSLISDDETLQMKYYSRKYFPPADDYVSWKKSSGNSDSCATFPSLWLGTCFAYSHMPTLKNTISCPKICPSHSRHFKRTYYFVTILLLLLFFFFFFFGGSMMINKMNMCPLTIYIAYSYSTNLYQILCWSMYTLIKLQTKADKDNPIQEITFWCANIISRQNFNFQ